MKNERLNTGKVINGLRSLFFLFPFSFLPLTAQTVLSPCPEVLITQKYDHVPLRQYAAKGWDTVVTCATPTIELSTEPYIPVQYFNGTYLVEEIPYAPVDTTFCMGTRMPVTTDDDFAATPTPIPYPFYFFGIRKTAFVLGANGLVTFNTSAAGHGCPWKFSAPIPWPAVVANSTPATYGTTLGMMRDAIYGVYEDTHPLASYLSGNQGIYYGIQDEFPCRKIVCSWNGVPAYPGNQNQGNRGTYQIVCYEGSNIIEVHVKRRGAYTGWNGGAGIIGIQNATGNLQQPDPDLDSSNSRVVPNSPAAFFPEGRNTFNTNLDTVAYRFTPLGTTDKSYKWYRIFDDGRDSVMLTTNQNDTNGYFIPMPTGSSATRPTLTRAIVSPKCVSRYVMELRFCNAANQWYNLRDTITVGIDTLNDLRIKLIGATSDTAHVMDICQAHASAASLVFPEGMEMDRTVWTLTRELNGARVPLADSLYHLDESKAHLTLHADVSTDTSLPLNKIDSIWLHVIVDFVSGCTNYDSALIRVFPNFDVVDEEGICRGDTYVWPLNGQSYTENTNAPKVTLKSQPGCDSVVHLHLTVFDVSHTVDRIMDCKPLTWLNGRIYSETNTATTETDTVILQNKWGCDSIVQLDFTIHPLTPIIESSLTNFDFDHLDVVLTDMSIGNDARRWKLPTGDDQTGTTAYYTIPVELDEGLITLIVSSPYGCIDSATLLLPFNKETFWVPNIFTPDKEDANNRFGSVSRQTVTQDMYIYTRNGQLVFHCGEVDCQWDGNYADGTPCPQGTYAYVIRYTNAFEPGKTHIIKGTVTLIR